MPFDLASDLHRQEGFKVTALSASLPSRPSLPSSHTSPEILCSFSLTFQVPQDRCHAACCAPLSLSSARLVGALGPPLTGIAPVGLEEPLMLPLCGGPSVLSNWLFSISVD